MGEHGDYDRVIGRTQKREINEFGWVGCCVVILQKTLFKEQRLVQILMAHISQGIELFHQLAAVLSIHQAYAQVSINESDMLEIRLEYQKSLCPWFQNLLSTMCFLHVFYEKVDLRCNNIPFKAIFGIYRSNMAIS
jgi:hypothetical protein